MKKIKIAFTGVFDIDNFGDHLFPIIFENSLRKRKIDVELFLFSPYESTQGFGIAKKVYSIREMEKLHKINNFDAIVVGGGEIIHFYSFKQKNHEEKYVEYPIFETWIVPSIIGRKYGIPVIWNNPGCPFEFDGYQDYIARKVLSNVSFLSVRNQFSFDTLRNYNANAKVSVYTAFNIKELFPKWKLKRPVNGKYVVFHSNRFIGDNAYQSALEELLELSKTYKIVLLPLAITNDDSEILNKIYKDSNEIFILPSKQLTMKEIVSYLAFCDLYIGVSFHGAITAFSYGNPVVGFDFVHNKKTRDLYNQLGLSEQYVSDESMLHDGIKCAFEREQKQLKSIYKNMKQKLDIHFDEIADILREHSQCGYSEDFLSFSDVIGEFSSMLSVLSNEYRDRTGIIEKYKSEAQYNLMNWQKCSNEMIELYNKYQKLADEYKELKERMECKEKL